MMILYQNITIYLKYHALNFELSQQFFHKQNIFYRISFAFANSNLHLRLTQFTIINSSHQMKTQSEKFSLNKQLYKLQEFQYPNHFSPFIQQQYFAEELFQITQRYIPTSYGQIYSITAGSPGQPLILIVHGSGPKNSSAQYNLLLQEYLVRVSYIEKFYLVAIDCPGYGKSIGSKQAVKTFPLQMFQEILKGLNYKKYFAMYGHSQGGAAIFNAVFQNPSLSQILIMDRPVCGNIQRFRKFHLPTLLIYDIQDDGHPIWQGKLLYKQLALSELYTYRSSQDPFWVPDNIWDKMLEFFCKYANNRKGRQNPFYKTRAVSLSPQVQHKSNVFKQKESGKENTKIKSKQKQLRQTTFAGNKPRNSSKSLSISLQNKRKPHSLDSINLKKLKQFPQKGNKNQQKQLQSVEQLQIEKDDLLSIYSSSLSEQQKQQLVKLEEQLKFKEEQLLKDQKNDKLLFGKEQKIYEIAENVVIEKVLKTQPEQSVKQKFLSKDLKQTQKKNEKNQDQPKQKKQKTKSQEQQDNLRCAICYEMYYRPIQTNCNHIFCTKCLLQSLLVSPRCPLCRGNITKKTQKKQLHQQILLKLSPEAIQKRQKAYLRLKLMLDSTVYIEIGNRSIELQTKKSHHSKTKKKYMWELFAREKVGFKFQQVSFDINMGNPQSKPVRVKNSPFLFQSRGTFSFSCEITVRPKNNEYAPLTTVYRINLQPGVHKQVIAFRKKIYLKEKL